MFASFAKRFWNLANQQQLSADENDPVLQHSDLLHPSDALRLRPLTGREAHDLFTADNAEPSHLFDAHTTLQSHNQLSGETL